MSGLFWICEWPTTILPLLTGHDLASTAPLVFSNLDRPSAPKAWRPGLALRLWAGPAAVSEHPAMMWFFLLPRGSSFRSADADRFLPNQCQLFDRCRRAWDQSRRPYRRCCRDRRVRHQRPKRLRQACEDDSSPLVSILRRVASSAPL
jgi:hypothetical protein